jgi:hypothetical protein
MVTAPLTWATTGARLSIDSHFDLPTRLDVAGRDAALSASRCRISSGVLQRSARRSVYPKPCFHCVFLQKCAPSFSDRA